MIAWYIAGAIYFIVAIILYKGGLPFHMGQPIFNIIDVGFINSIVQYTGGPRSLAQLLYLVSIFAVVHNYKKTKHDRPHPMLLTIPYFFALGLAYFWTCAESILFRRHSWDDYAIPAIVAITSAIIIYLTGRYFEDDEKSG